jgi:oxygen-independent coproporphyrinogen-3 oxidase
VVIAGAAAFGPRSRMGGYLTAVEREIDLRANASDTAFGALGEMRSGVQRAPLETLYLGGGTPSLLPSEQLASLISRVRDRFGLASGAEVTLECNPGADERGDFTASVQAGVTRFSIGAQSMDVAALRDLGRRHGPDDVAASIREARAAGATSVSIDLLADLPGVSLESWARSLDAALALQPDHISVYALTLALGGADEGEGIVDDRLATPAGAIAWRQRAAAEQDEERGAQELELLDTQLPAAGLNWYEISNWARAGHTSRHNRLYWERASVEAVGPGAHAFDGAARRWNSANLDAWEEALTNGELPPGGASVQLSDRDAAAEALVLSLRMARGVDREDAVAQGFAEALIWGEANGVLAPHPEDATRVQLTMRGRLLSNELFSRIV